MIDGEVVVIDLRSGNYFSLVESAAVIWASLAARPTHDEVAAYLGRVYDAEPEQCFAVSGAFLDVLVAEGLVVQVDAPRTPGRAAVPAIAAITGPLPEAPAREVRRHAAAHPARPRARDRRSGGVAPHAGR